MNGNKFKVSCINNEDLWPAYPASQVVLLNLSVSSLF